MNYKVTQSELKKTLVLIGKSSGIWAVINSLVMIGRALFPLAGVLLLKKLVDTVLTINTTSGNKSSGIIIWLVISIAVVLFIDDLLVIFSRYSVKKQSKLLEEHFLGRIHSHASILGLKSFENHSFHELLDRAANDASWRPASIVTNFVLILRGALSFIIMAIVLSQLNILLALVLPVAFIPVFLSKTSGSKRLYEARMLEAPLSRRASYFSWLITGERPAREVKLFGLGDYFDTLFRKYFNESKEAELEAIRKGSVSEAIAAGIKAVVITGVIIYLTFSMTRGNITAGDLAMYLVACRQAMVCLRDAFTGLAGVKEDKLFLSDFFSFIEQKNDIVAIEPVESVAGTKSIMEVQNVSFSYSENAEPAIKNVSFSISAGEKLAIVGANGSGKSTLVKLLCRLYDPDDGVIKYSGTDIRHFNPDEYRRMFSVVFQDFMLYYLTVRENIALSDRAGDQGNESISKAAIAAGLGDLFSSFPDGIDTSLGHMSPGGRELSWGEWQKIAIARALFRKAPVLILDEPSSSLDADSEYEIFSRLETIAAGKTTVFISHRLSNILCADRIIVLEKGEIAESGTHEELIEKRGIYYSMYSHQKSMYR